MSRSLTVDDVLGLVLLALGTRSPSLSELQNALTACRTVLIDQRNKISQLEEEIAAFKEHQGVGTANNAAGQVQWLSHSRLIPHKTEIVRLSKKYALLFELWPEEAVFLQRCPAKRPSFAEVANLSTEDEAALYTLCATYELYDVMPTEFHSFIEQLPAFRDAVFTQAQSFRSTSVSNLRKYADKIFAGLGISSACWDQTYNRLEDDSCLRLITCKPKAVALKYDLFCPIIYLNPNKLRTDTMFLNPVLMKIARFLLFGPGALMTGKISSNAIGMKWGSIRTTSGLILASINIAVYLLSADKEFASTGKITQIHYSNTFRERKMFIDRMSSDRKPWVSDLFAKWDQVVFAGVPISVYQSESSPMSDEREVARQALLSATSSSVTGEDFDWSDDLNSEHGYISAPTPLERQLARPNQSSSISTAMQAPALTGAAISPNSALMAEKSASNISTLSANSTQSASHSASGSAARKLTAFPASITPDLYADDSSDSDQFQPAPSWCSQDPYDVDLTSEVEELSIHQDTDTPDSTTSQTVTRPSQGRHSDSESAPIRRGRGRPAGRGRGRGRGRAETISEQPEVTVQPLARRSGRSRK
ncbi:hypothetical protein C0992_009420 [Termitomyces sp. T32_za158]|nr:hypothetical protein C0992_009420 [Termitomyces sp. T32_za158]